MIKLSLSIIQMTDMIIDNTTCHSCMICRYAIKNTDDYDMCNTCHIQFLDFLNKSFGVVIGTNLSPQKQIVKDAINEMFGIDKKIKSNNRLPTYIRSFCNNTHAWKGFFSNQYEWIEIKPYNMKINISDITKNNAHEVIIRELNKNGIDLYGQIQINITIGHLAWM